MRAQILKQGLGAGEPHGNKANQSVIWWDRREGLPSDDMTLQSSEASHQTNNISQTTCHGASSVRQDSKFCP